MFMLSDEEVDNQRLKYGLKFLKMKTDNEHDPSP